MQKETEIPAKSYSVRRPGLRRIALRSVIAILLLAGAFILFLGWQMHRPVHIQDGFEEVGLGPVWISYQLVPKAFTIQSTIVRSGRSAAQITLKPGDRHEDRSEEGDANERDEVMEAPWFWSRMGRTYAYSFSLYLPKDFPVVDTRLVIAQWKQLREWRGCRPVNPVLAIRYVGGDLFVTRRNDEKQVELFRSQGEMRGRWLDFSFVTRFSQHEDGLVAGWLNGQQIIKYHGITAYRTSFGYPAHGFFYFKMGLYRDLMREPMTIYLDDFRKDQVQESAYQ